MESSTKLMDNIREALISRNPININKVFIGKKSLSFKYANQDIKIEYSLRKYQIAILLRMSVFSYFRCIEAGKLTSDNNYNFRVIIITLLCIAKDLESQNEVFIKECSMSIFKNPLVLQYFSPVYKKKNLTIKLFMETFRDICVTLNDLSEESLCCNIIELYKEKMLNQLKSSIENSKIKDRTKYCVKSEFFELFHFNNCEILCFITIIMELPITKFSSSDNNFLSIWGILLPELLKASLQHKSISRKIESSLDLDLFRKLFSYLIDLKASGIDVALWETNLCEYLQYFPHLIRIIDRKLIVLLLRSRILPETIKLLSLLIKRNPAIFSYCMKILKKDEVFMREASVVFTLLTNNLSRDWDKEFLMKLNDFHREEIIRYLMEFSIGDSWIQKNLKSVKYLIDTTFDVETCQKICDMILINKDKLVKVDVDYVQLLESMFRKIGSIKDLTQVILVLLTSVLKVFKNKVSSFKNKEKLNYLTQTLIRLISELKIQENNLSFDELSKNYSWSQFVKFSLSQALSAKKENIIFDNTLLLKALILTLKVTYPDNGNDEYVKTIFGLATSHSEYIDAMLSNNTNVKRFLVELLLVLIRKNRGIMLPNHIPLYLAAYNATLSETDQIILLILKEYEKANINLKKYRPFLWGSTAASYYSVKEDPNTALFREPNTSQVLFLFEPELVNETITNFPIHRSLENDVLCVPKSVYDPVFYLPLLYEILAENNVVAYYKVIHSGALALILIACSSNCEEIRLTAFTNISRFYVHLENFNFQRSNEKLLWIRFIDALRNGIAEIQSPINKLRLNGFLAIFLARATIIGSQPLNPLYRAIHNFFMAKHALKLKIIPEFKKLFYSSEIEYENHRKWILEIIRDGFKSEHDFQVAKNYSLFNIVMSFYICSLSDRKTKKLILEVVNSAVKIPKIGMHLIDYYGIIPWMNTVINRLDDFDSDSLFLLIKIIVNLSELILERKVLDKFHLFTLMQIFVRLKSRITCKNMTVPCFTIYVRTLEKIFIVADFDLSDDYVKSLLELSKSLLGEMEECEYLLEFGSEFAAKEDDFEPDNEVSIARESFRKFILSRQSSIKEKFPKEVTENL